MKVGKVGLPLHVAEEEAQTKKANLKNKKRKRTGRARTVRTKKNNNNINYGKMA